MFVRTYGNGNGWRSAGVRGHLEIRKKVNKSDLTVMAGVNVWLCGCVVVWLCGCKLKEEMGKRDNLGAALLILIARGRNRKKAMSREGTFHSEEDHYRGWYMFLHYRYPLTSRCTKDMVYMAPVVIC